MSEWEPIESAPRDNYRILAWFPWAKFIAIVSWRQNVYEHAVAWTLEDGESARLAYDPPTHWMPLPEPPK